MQKVCPCIIVVHSQVAIWLHRRAERARQGEALIAVEPSGAPDPAKADAAKVKGIPLLTVWGDFIDQHPVWPKITPNPIK